jgi:hypothetical protein
MTNNEKEVMREPEPSERFSVFIKDHTPEQFESGSRVGMYRFDDDGYQFVLPHLVVFEMFERSDEDLLAGYEDPGDSNPAQAPTFDTVYGISVCINEFDIKLTIGLEYSETMGWENPLTGMPINSARAERTATRFLNILERMQFAGRLIQVFDDG